MLNIKLTQSAYLQSGEYRLHTDDGKPSISVLHEYYTAHAIGDDGNDYDVYWSIANKAAFDAGDEDCCNWDEPDEIYSWSDHKPVSAKIYWIKA